MSSDIVPVAPLGPFADGLASHQDPRFIAPLAHALTVDGPAGEVTGVAEPVPSTSSETVFAPPPSRPTGIDGTSVMQRFADPQDSVDDAGPGVVELSPAPPAAVRPDPVRPSPEPVPPIVQRLPVLPSADGPAPSAPRSDSAGRSPYAGLPAIKPYAGLPAIGPYDGLPAIEPRPVPSVPGPVVARVPDPTVEAAGNADLPDRPVLGDPARGDSAAVPAQTAEQPTVARAIGSEPAPSPGGVADAVDPGILPPTAIGLTVPRPAAAPEADGGTRSMPPLPVVSRSIADPAVPVDSRPSTPAAETAGASTDGDVPSQPAMPGEDPVDLPLVGSASPIGPVGRSPFVAALEDLEPPTAGPHTVPPATPDPSMPIVSPGSSGSSGVPAVGPSTGVQRSPDPEAPGKLVVQRVPAGGPGAEPPRPLTVAPPKLLWPRPETPSTIQRSTPLVSARPLIVPDAGHGHADALPAVQRVTFDVPAQVPAPTSATAPVTPTSRHDFGSSPQTARAEPGGETVAQGQPLSVMRSAAQADPDQHAVNVSDQPAQRTSKIGAGQVVRAVPLQRMFGGLSGGGPTNWTDRQVHGPPASPIAGDSLPGHGSTRDIATPLQWPAPIPVQAAYDETVAQAAYGQTTSGRMVHVQRDEAPAPAATSVEPAAPAAPAAPEPAAPAETPAASSPPAAGAPAAAASPTAAATDIDEMAKRLYEPLTARLRAELWLDRERAGLVNDRWR